MNINRSKLAQFYQQCLEIVKIKRQSFQMLTDLFFICQQITFSQPKHMPDKGAKKIYKGLQKLLNQWQKSFNAIKPIAQDKLNIKFLENAIQKIKNSSYNQILQDSLRQQIMNQIQKHKMQTNDTLTYYDLRNRESLRNGISQKLQEISKYRKANKQTQKPLFMIQFEQENKNYLIQLSNSQIDLDENYGKQLKSVFAYINQLISDIYEWAKNIELDISVGNIKSYFIKNNVFVFDQKGKLSGSEKTNYLKSVKQTLILIKENIEDYEMSYSELQKYLQALILQYGSKIQKFYKDYDRIYKRMTKISQHSISLIPTNYILISLQLNKKYHQFNSIFKMFLNIIRKCIKDFLESINRLSREINKIQYNIAELKPSQVLQSFRNIKLLLQNIEKNIKTILSQILQGFINLCKETKNVCSIQDQWLDRKHKIKRVEQKMVNKIFNRLFFDQDIQEKSNKKQEMFKSISYTGQQFDKVSQSKSYLDDEVNKFIKQLKLGQFTPDIAKDVSSFACALGPRLLVTGKIYAYYEGIYFESLFNKKNVVFGKTKLFVPRKDITGFNPRSMLGFIPDIIDVETTHGTLVFHSLGWRQTALDILNQCYFPEAINQDDQQLNEEQFVEVPPQMLQKLKNLHNQTLAPYPEQLVHRKLKNCKLTKYFKRYLSDEKFEFKGKQYQNYKVYILGQNQCLNPKATQITPQPPYYFQYKSKGQVRATIPQTSQRISSYQKKLPRIPFISSGDQGFCEQKEKYYWISPQLLIIEGTTIILGFSLTENMQIKIKTVYRQVQADLDIHITCNVIFTISSSTDGLVGGPALSSARVAFNQGMNFIEKYEQTMQRRKGHKKKDTNNGQVQQLKNTMQSILGGIEHKIKKEDEISVINFWECILCINNFYFPSTLLIVYQFSYFIISQLKSQILESNKNYNSKYIFHKINTFSTFHYLNHHLKLFQKFHHLIFVFDLLLVFSSHTTYKQEIILIFLAPALYLLLCFECVSDMELGLKRYVQEGLFTFFLFMIT